LGERWNNTAITDELSPNSAVFAFATVDAHQALFHML
jgi:hypothetical protein